MNTTNTTNKQWLTKEQWLAKKQEANKVPATGAQVNLIKDLLNKKDLEGISKEQASKLIDTLKYLKAKVQVEISDKEFQDIKFK